MGGLAGLGGPAGLGGMAGPGVPGGPDAFGGLARLGGASGVPGMPGGLDLGRMMQALSGLQDLQRQASAPISAGFGQVPNPFAPLADGTAMWDPLAPPVTVISGPTPPPSPTASWTPAPDEPVADPGAAREALHALLPQPGPAGALDLLDDDAPTPKVGLVDDLVALAGALADAGAPAEADHLWLAVGLYLRSRIDKSGGWGDEAGEGGNSDARAAAESLVDAADALVGEADPTTVALAVRLSTLLDPHHSAGLETRLAAPFADVTAALRAAGAGGLLFPAAGRSVLLSAETGRFGPATAGLPARLLVVGDAPVPDELPVPADAVVSHVRSAAQAVALAGRARLPLTGAPVVVANPRGDRKQATLDALVLRGAVYPRSTGLGETAEHVDGAGTPDDVRARLDASMLHLGCGVTPDGGLELAGPGVLTPTEIAVAPQAAAGGLAILPPSSDGTPALTDALLTSRFTGVVRLRADVPDDVASILYLVLHMLLVDGDRHPAEAVAAVHRWLADTNRAAPDHLPPWLEALATSADLADPAYRSVLVHHGM